ncbi:hypothetical protein D3C73_1644020 [compost metagenome]
MPVVAVTMLEGLTSSAIITEATTWISGFGDIPKTLVGIGAGFAVIRFVKNLFF